MKIRVLFFAHAADAAGCAQLELTFADGASVEDVVDALCARYPDLIPLRDSITPAVDERYASMSAPLSDGQTLALIPPVSGG